MIEEKQSSKKIIVFLLILIFLLFFKIDFRFEDGIFCCGDDHDYYSHAETLVEDFDFDYSNQYVGHETRRFNLNGKIAPKGFFGSGLLAAPFLMIGNLVQFLINKFSNVPIVTFFNYKLLFYSLSAPTYFFMSVLLLSRIFILNKIKVPILTILLLLSSSGVAYYAFERFSMTHVYEVFTVTLICYFTTMFHISKQSNKYAALTAFSMLLAFLVRMVNYYIFIIPLIIKILSKNKYQRNIYKSRYFLISSAISLLVFSYLSLKIYGIVTINPETLYGQKGYLSNFLESTDFINFVIINIKNILIVIFGKEFGLLWFSPILIIGPMGVLLKVKNYKIIELLILFLPFSISMGAVLLWQSAASSYGFRYLLSLAPLGIIYYYFNVNIKENPKINNLLLSLAVFSLVSILFFETTVLTQLSLFPEVNSFGRELRYVEPDYLIGYIQSIFSVESYLKIFTTSFLGVFFFKLVIGVFGEYAFVDFLSQLGLPTNNNDFIQFLLEIELVSSVKILIVIVYFYFISNVLVNEQK